jgi:hypothetical protein
MAATNPHFSVALAHWLAGAQAKIDAHFAQHFTLVAPPKLSLEPGQRYVKVVSTGDRGQRSVFAFIDSTNGDVLKAESWRKPAKHARGNLFDPTGGLGRVGVWGPEYLR